MNDVKRNSPWRSPWVLFWIGLLVVFVAVNLVMISLSRSVNPGLVVDDYYERGQDYEKNMLKRLSREHGWSTKIKVPKGLEPEKGSTFSISISDKDGKPVSPDGVMFYAYRPSDAKQDFSLPMQAVTPGAYSAEVSFPIKGAWDLLFSVKSGEDEFNFPRRVMIGRRN